MPRIMNAVTFLCSKCQSEKLVKPGSARTDNERLFMTFECAACHMAVNIEVDKIIASLYTVPFAAESPLVH